MFKIFLAFFCCCISVAQAQTLSRKVVKKIPVQNILQLDSLNILSSSVKIFDAQNNIIDTSYYSIDGINRKLQWKKNIDADSVKIEYITFPFNLTKSFYRKQIQDIPKEEVRESNPFSYMPGKDNAAGIIDFGNLDYNGSFSRGLSFGNNQDVVLNSSLNLQLAGNITDDLEISAALTDNNIPVQPDGNTQQIQEFDRVYIQVGNKTHQVVLGDYDAQSFNRYFMRFYKRLQGISYRGNLKLDSTITLNSNSNFAIARGKFTRNQLNISEGNQGPYRLIGADGETFIIVLAGTERVFVNGQLKTRGADRDYIIDYNTGEITFMPTIIITRDTRVFVEFEYAVRNYFRTIFYTANDIKVNEKLKFNINFYNEQDNKNQPVNLELTDEQKAILRNAGDNLQAAVVPGFTSGAFEPNRIQYQLIDTTVLGFTYDSVFVYSTNPENAIYRIIFSEVGIGKGNYVRSGSTANGAVFAWTAPDVLGNKTGNFEPVTILITPKREQLLTGGLEYVDTKNKLMIDLGLSNDDANTFAEKGDGDNVGVASRINYDRKFFLNQSEKKDFYISTGGYYEFANHNFNALERYRPVEFNRDWNIKSTTQKIDEHWAGANFGIAKDNRLKAFYNFNTFQKGDFYKGYMNALIGSYIDKKYFVDAQIRFTSSQDTLGKGQYFWPKIEVAKAFEKLKFWKVGGRFEKEDNQLARINSDSLLSGSFLFNDWRVYITSPDSANNKGSVEYIRRQEFFPQQGTMRLATTSNTYNFSGEWLNKEWQQLRWRLTYRQFENGDTIFTNNVEEQFYLGRVEYNINLLKGFINVSNLYELGSGREQRRTFSFFEVPAGQGNYIWRDYNENGIQELNEFEILPPGFEDQARFIKVTNPTNEFQPVNITTFNTALNLNPKSKWYGKKGVLGFAARFSTLTSLQINRKVFRESSASPFNPFVFDNTDTSLVAYNSLIRQSIFFNRSSSVWGIEYSWQNNQNRNFLVTGFEARSILEHLLRIRWNVAKQFSIITKTSTGTKGNNTELFTDRNYSIKYYTVEPDFTFLFQNKFRASLLYKFSASKNILGEINETAKTHDITNELRYNVVSKSTLSTKFTFAIVNYQGDDNATIDNAIQFAMLQGLQNGNNFLWNFSFDRNLANNIQLSLVYEGRKTGIADAVHTGRAQVRAIF